jgi:hypothetical protein
MKLSDLCIAFCIFFLSFIPTFSEVVTEQVGLGLIDDSQKCDYITSGIDVEPIRTSVENIQLSKGDIMVDTTSKETVIAVGVGTDHFEAHGVRSVSDGSTFSW